MIKKVQKHFRRLLALVAYHLLKPFPKNNRIVVFSSERGQVFSGNTKYIFMEACRYPNIRPVWIANNNAVVEHIRKSGGEAYHICTAKAQWIQLRAKTVIITHSIKECLNFWLLAGATSINLWHGVGPKKSWYRNKNSLSGRIRNERMSIKTMIALTWARANGTKINYAVATSELVASYYPEMFNIPPENVLILGQARNDVFFSTDLEEGFLPEYFKTRKVITYMPTHRMYGKYDGQYEQEIANNINYLKLSKALNKYGYVFVIKQHSFNNDVVTQHNFNNGQTGLDNIYDITKDNNELDPQLILKYTDILVTDYSSCYADFMLLDRPIVFFPFDLDDYLAKWDLNFPYDEITPGSKVFDSDHLIEELEKLMQGIDGYHDERQRVKQIFYGTDNQQPVASKQMKCFINDIIKPG